MTTKEYGIVFAKVAVALLIVCVSLSQALTYHPHSQGIKESAMEPSIERDTWIKVNVRKVHPEDFIVGEVVRYIPANSTATKSRMAQVLAVAEKVLNNTKTLSSVNRVKPKVGNRAEASDPDATSDLKRDLFGSDRRRREGVERLGRLIALPGQVIELKKGMLHIDGRKQNEGYCNEKGELTTPPLMIPANHALVLPDLRWRVRFVHIKDHLVALDAITGRQEKSE